MAKMICTECGFTGKPKLQAKGSMAMEIVLWLLFLIPGFIYSMWRLTSKQKVCPKCQHPNMIPLDSPRGQKLAEEMGAQT